MALDQLLTVLTREAETESASLLDEARTQAQAIRDRAASDLARRRELEEGDREAERQQVMAVTRAGARSQARQAELVARDQMLARVMALAREQLPAAVERAEFRAGLPSMLAEALECLGDRAGSIRCSPALAADIGQFTASRAQLELVSDAAVDTGFQLSSADGSLLIDATLSHQSEQIGLELRQGILARLKEAP